MPFRGELDSVDLAHVFQMLVLNEKAGTLEIVHEGAKRLLWFGPEGVRIPFDRATIADRAGRALVREGRLSQSDLERARCNTSVSRKDVLDTLVDMQLVSAPDRDRAMKGQLEEQVYELFFLSGATFEFREGETPPGLTDEALALSANGLVMEAARRVDEWEYIRKLVHGGSDIFEIASDLTELDKRENTAELRAVHAALDGTSPVDEVIARTGICRFLVFRSLALLVERGIAVAVPSETLVERAQSLMSEGRLQSAIACLEQAIARGDGDVSVLAGAGQCYETLGEVARAAERYFAAGRAAEEQGDLDKAIRLFLRVRDLLPTKIEARLRLFALRKVVDSHVGRDRYDATADGHELSRVLHELGRREDVRLVLAGLLENAAEDASRLEAVADLAGSTGQSAFAIDALMLAKERRRLGGDLAGALRCVKRAQAIDASRDDLGQNARVLQSEIHDRRARRRGTVRAFAMVIGFAALFVGYGKYSKAALDSYGRYSIEDFVATHDYSGGRGHYEAIRRSYPLTIPFLLAAEKLRELEVHQRHHEEIEQFRSQVQGEQRATNLKQAKSLLDAALEARHSGDYRKSLELLRKAARCSGDQDPLDLASAVGDLEEYLAAAARLRAEATFFRNAGRFDDAHGRLVDVLHRYPNAPDVDDVTLPIRIESDPPGASIRVGGEPLRIGDGSFMVEAETPFVVDLPATGPVDVELVKDGFVPYLTRFDARLASALVVTLPRRPTLEAIMPRPVSQPFLVAGDVLYVALESGRVSSLHASTLEVRWTRELPELSDVSAPLALAGDLLLVPASTRKIFVLSTRDGAMLREITLADKPVSAPIVSNGSIVVRCEGGGMAIGGLDAPGLDVIALPCPVVLGPVSLPGSRLAVACDDGRVWVRASDGTLSALRGEGAPIGTITAMVADDTTLWLGDDRGSLSVFDATTQAQRCSVRVFEGGPVDRISPDANFPAVGSGGRIAVVDCRKNLVSAPVAVGAALAEANGPWFATIAANGTIQVLSREGLHPVGSFACGEKLTGQGVMNGGRGYFAAAGGRVVGFAVDAVENR